MRLVARNLFDALFRGIFGLITSRINAKDGIG
jgi:hypothetical protein